MLKHGGGHATLHYKHRKDGKLFLNLLFVHPFLNACVYKPSTIDTMQLLYISLANNMATRRTT